MTTDRVVPFFAVLGPHRSGTSCVAMVMHHLGVYMGHDLVGYEPTGGGEDRKLMQLCEHVMRFPAMEPTVDDEQLTQMLRTWIQQHLLDACPSKAAAGAKYPHLCRFAQHLYAVLGSALRVVSVERDIDASIRSLRHRSQMNRGQWFASGYNECDMLQRSLLAHRERFIDEHPSTPVFRIKFPELIARPQDVIEDLVDFAGITPTPERLQIAIDHVKPQLRKFG